MAERVTAKSVTAEQNDVDREDDGADADSESITEPKRLPDVVAQNQNENEREIQKIAVHILHDERERTLT